MTQKMSAYATKTLVVGALFILVFFYTHALTAYAAVRISEVAWMGTVNSANDEWIELYNDGGAAVPLDGWALSSADGQPNIALTGAIGAGAYFLLERTSDDTISGVTADQIYVGSLSNAGEMFSLTDSSGTTVDQVDGSGSWAIGGNNDTKDTLQRVGGAWVTGKPTPGKINTTDQTPSVSSENTKTKTTTSSSTQKTASPTAAKTTTSTTATPTKTATPAFSIEAYRAGTTGVPMHFAVKTSGNVIWVFGDGATAQGANVSHTYSYEGTYVVVAKGNEDSGEDSFEVSIAKSHVELGTITRDYVELKNRGESTVDLSGWLLTEGVHTFVFPDGTQLLKDATIHVTAAVSGLVVTNPNYVALYYPNQTLAAFSGATKDTSITQQVTSAVSEVIEVPQITTEQETVIKKEKTERETPKTTIVGGVRKSSSEEVSPEDLLAAAAAADVPSHTPMYLWLLGLAALCVAAVAIVLLLRKDSEEQTVEVTTPEE